MVQFGLIFQADTEHLLLLPAAAEKQESFDLSVTPEILKEELREPCCEQWFVHTFDI